MADDNTTRIPDAKPAIYRWIIGALLFLLNYAWNEKKAGDKKLDAANKREDTLSIDRAELRAEIKVRNRIDSVEKASKFIYSRDAPVDRDTGLGVDSTKRNTGI